jgi:hypothetical protein
MWQSVLPHVLAPPLDILNLERLSLIATEIADPACDVMSIDGKHGRRVRLRRGANQHIHGCVGHAGLRLITLNIGVKTDPAIVNDVALAALKVGLIAGKTDWRHGRFRRLLG